MIETRLAVKEDIPAVYSYICKLGEYQSMDKKTFCITEETLHQMMDGHTAEIAIAFYDGKPAGIGLYNVVQSGFTGRFNLYLEIFYVEKELRGKGIGTSILKFMAEECVRKDYDRIDWVCRTFNTPSLKYYEGIGADKLDDRYWFRMTNDRIRSFLKE